jgi:hypothetical protein
VNPQYLLVVAVAIVMGWFAFGVIYNLRRGDKLLKWMQTGLPRIGTRTTFRWLGTSVAELVIASARKPFRRLETLLVLKPRDVFWMTLTAMAQGRDDIVIYRAQLSDAPLLDLELADSRTWSGRNALKETAARGWESKEYQNLTLMAPKGLLDLASRTLDGIALPLQGFSQKYVRFALRKGNASMEVHVPFPNPPNTDAQAYFEALRTLAKAVAERQ